MDIEGGKKGVMVEVAGEKIIVGDALHPRTGGEVEEADLDHSPPGGTVIKIKMDGLKKERGAIIKEFEVYRKCCELY